MLLNMEIRCLQASISVDGERMIYYRIFVMVDEIKSYLRKQNDQYKDYITTTYDKAEHMD